MMRMALTEIAGLSPYLVVGTGPLPEGARPTSRLQDTDLVQGLVDDMAARMGTTEARVACSTLFFGYVARLWSVALGTAARTGRSLAIGPEQLWWRTGQTGLELYAPNPGVGSDPATEVLTRQAEPVIDVWRRWVAAGALWGNTASALRGAGRVLGPDAVNLEAAAWGHPLLRGRLAEDGRRRSCCLFYRSARGGYCADCSIINQPLEDA